MSAPRTSDLGLSNPGIWFEPFRIFIPRSVVIFATRRISLKHSSAEQASTFQNTFQHSGAKFCGKSGKYAGKLFVTSAFTTLHRVGCGSVARDSLFECFSKICAYASTRS